MTYRLFRPSAPPIDYSTPRAAHDAVETLDSVNERAVLCGVRADGTLAEAIVSVGMSREAALALAESAEVGS